MDENKKSGRARPAGQRLKKAGPASDTATENFHTTSDGQRLFYSIEGKGLPVVFCYGLVCSSLHFTYQIEALKNKYQTIWMDYRGHQRSPMPTDLGTLTIEQFAEDLISLLDHLNIPKFFLVGHSMGSNVVLQVAKKYPERIYGCIVSGATARYPFETLLNTNALERAFHLLKVLEKNSPQLLQTVWKWQKANTISHKLIGFLGFNASLTAPEDIALYVDQIADLDPRVFVELIKNYGELNSTLWLNEIKVPLLNIIGEADWIVPRAEQELISQLIATSRMVTIQKGSHCPQMDFPELFNTYCESFFVETLQLETGNEKEPSFKIS